MLMLRWTLDDQGRLTATVVRLPTRTRPLALLNGTPQSLANTHAQNAAIPRRAASAEPPAAPEPEAAGWLVTPSPTAG